MYYTEHKPKNKNRGGLGKAMRLGGNPSVYISSFHDNETRWLDKRLAFFLYHKQPGDSQSYML